MAALSQARAVSGCRAFTGIRPRQVAQVSNGCKVFMRRKDSYMVEVNLGEEEPEDIAVRRFMKAVMESKVIEKLRARRYTESKIEAYKRRMRERHEIRKLDIVEPTWEDVNGDDMSPKVFDEFFAMDPDGDFGMPPDDGFMGGYNDSMWGGYMDNTNNRSGNWNQGGYMDDRGNQSGGYMNQQMAGATTYPVEGGYLNAAAAQDDGPLPEFIYTAPASQ